MNMTTKRAYQIVRELAEENVIEEQYAEENDMPEAREEQFAALEHMDSFMKSIGGWGKK